MSETAGLCSPKDVLDIYTRLYPAPLYRPQRTHPRPNPKLTRDTRTYMYTTQVPHGEEEGAYIPGPVGKHPRMFARRDPRAGHLSTLTASYRQAACQEHSGSPARMGSCTKRRVVCHRTSVCTGSPPRWKLTPSRTHALRNAECCDPTKQNPRKTKTTHALPAATLIETKTLETLREQNHLKQRQREKQKQKPNSLKTNY